MDVEDEVADSFALFSPIKSTSGFAATEAEGDSYDRLSTGGAAIAMADSGYQTYDHDLSQLDGRQSHTINVMKLFAFLSFHT